MSKLRAPFPWFGGKSRASSLIWEGLGDVPNYVEPFAGSLAVLLGRPTAPRTETVNDLDCYVANFWRALAADPEALAAASDWPVNEADLHARHRWLVGRKKFRARMRSSPTFFDVRIAGWWVWGLSCWIGGGWCSATEGGPPRGNGSPGGAYLSHVKPKLDRGGAHGVQRRTATVSACGSRPRASRPTRRSSSREDDRRGP